MYNKDMEKKMGKHNKSFSAINTIRETSSEIFQNTSESTQPFDFSHPYSIFSLFPKREIDETLQENSPYPMSIFIDMHEAEIAELKERIEKLEEIREQQLISIQFMESSQLILKQPIFVNLSYNAQNGIYIVDCPELEIYGEGRDEQESIMDFKIAMEELYFNLKKDKEKLGLALEKKWNILKNIIEEK